MNDVNPPTFAEYAVYIISAAAVVWLLGRLWL